MPKRESRLKIFSRKNSEAAVLDSEFRADHESGGLRIECMCTAEMLAVSAFGMCGLGSQQELIFKRGSGSSCLEIL